MDNLQAATNKVDIQLATELYYSKKATDKRILNIIDNDQDILDNISKSVTNIELWSLCFDGYDSKRVRLDILNKDNDIESIVKGILVMVMKLCNRDDMLSSIAGQASNLIKGMTNREAVITVSEMIALMDKANLIYLEDRKGFYEDEYGNIFPTVSKYVVNPWSINDATKEHIQRAMYLPPLIIKPMKLKRNNHSVYLNTSKDSLILGKGNYHNEKISLDVLNILNSTALSINTEMLKYLTEDLLLNEGELSAMKSDPKRKEQYDKLMKESAYVYAYLVNNGNEFYLGHKFDKRGRTYAQGYHCSYQGNAFRKSVVDLKKEVYIEPTF